LLASIERNISLCAPRVLLLILSSREDNVPVSGTPSIHLLSNARSLFCSAWKIFFERERSFSVPLYVFTKILCDNSLFSFLTTLWEVAGVSLCVFQCIQFFSLKNWRRRCVFTSELNDNSGVFFWCWRAVPKSLPGSFWFFSCQFSLL
jgi:hypothetical protein